MNQIIIGIAVVLILAILVLMFRIQTLLNVMRGSYRKVGLSNKINAILFPIFGIVGFAMFFWYSAKAKEHYLPEASSIHGIETDFMFWLTIGILVFTFVVTHIFLFLFPVKYQYRENNTAYYYPDNHRLEFVWTIIPAIVLAILVYFGWKTWSNIMQKEPDNSVVVEVMGQQFNWIVRYPGADHKLGDYNFKQISPDNQFGLLVNDKKAWDDFMPKEIHIPVNHPVLLKIRARDVLHSVFLPHFRVKMDAVPGMPTKFWFTPTKTTSQMRKELSNPNFNYELACTELCGKGHFSMRYILVVDTKEEYEAWYKSEKTWGELSKDYILANISESLKSSFESSLKKEETTTLAATTEIVAKDSATAVADSAAADSVSKDTITQ